VDRSAKSSHKPEFQQNLQRSGVVSGKSSHSLFIEPNLSVSSATNLDALTLHLLAAKTETDEVIIDKLIRPCILDPSLPIHDDIHIFYWIYPYEKTIIFRDFGMPAVRGQFNKPGFFNQ